MRRMKIIVVTLIMALGLTLEYVPSLFAQTGETDEFTLEEITVTAQKREENLQKVAATMETISGYDLVEAGKTSIEDILTNIAGTWIQGSGVQFNIVMRGMDNDEGARSSFAMTAINVDGVYSNNREVGRVGVYDLERVEVMVGPQGTLWSRNAAGGVINFVTKNPTLERFEGLGSVDIGNFDALTLTGVMNVPVNDRFAFRAAFNSDSHDGYASNGVCDNDSKEARIKLLYHPNEDLSAILTYEFVKVEGPHGPTGYEAFEDEDKTDNPWTNNTELLHWRFHRHTNKANLNLNWTTPIGVVTFLPSIMIQKAPHDSQSRPSMTPEGLVYTYGWQDQDTKERAGELRLSSLDDSSWKWLLGAYYYFRGTYSNVTPLSANWGIQENESPAIFGNATIPITDRFRVTLGTRYTSEDELYEDYRAAPRPGEAPYSLNEYSSSHTDYKLAIEYDVSENSMLWVDYSTGYKHVTRNNLAQELNAYQLGAKNRFFNNRLQLNATAYYNDFSNYNVVHNRYYFDAAGEQQMDPGTGVGAATIYGLDLSTNYLITPNDRIDLQASMLHSEVRDLVIKYTYYYPPSDVFEGTELNNAPKLTATLGYQHTFNLRNGGNIRAKINTRYQTKTMLQFFLPDEDVPAGWDKDTLNHEPTHTISEVNVTYDNPTNRWSLSGYMKNIENHAIKYSYDARMGMIVGDPRTFGVVLSVNF